MMLDNFNLQLVRRFRRLFFCLSLLAVFSASGPTTAHAADLDIAVIDSRVLLDNLAKLRGIQDRLEGQKAKLQRELESRTEDLKDRQDKLKKNQLNMTRIEISRAEREILREQNKLQLLQRQSQEELEYLEKEEVFILRNELSGIIKEFLKKKSFDMVFFSDQLASFQDSLDVTDQVVRYIEETSDED